MVPRSYEIRFSGSFYFNDYFCLEGEQFHIWVINDSHDKHPMLESEESFYIVRDS